MSKICSKIEENLLITKTKQNKTKNNQTKTKIKAENKQKINLLI